MLDILGFAVQPGGKTKQQDSPEGDLHDKITLSKGLCTRVVFS